MVKMSRDEIFSRYAAEYDPIKIGSIDGTDTEPHDRALIRARNAEYSCNKLVKGDPYRTVFVARLNPRTTEQMLETEFSKFGEIRHIRLVKDIVTGKSKRYAFVEFKSLNSVESALRGMQGEVVDRSQVVVEREAERRLRGWRPRRLGGGFGGLKESGIMCFDVCCNEFKGWCGSFTRTERALTILEAFLLVALVVFLIFLILHLLICATDIPDIYEHVVSPAEIPDKSDHKEPTPTTPNSIEKYKTSMIDITTKSNTIDPSLECSWTPSAKTTALIHYYENGVTQTSKQTPTKSKVDIKYIKITSTQSEPAIHEKVQSKPVGEDFLESDQSDGEDADMVQSKHVLALVKLKPPQDVVFGCILTIVSEHWVLTAASCIEAIEEVDSLDSFVMMEDYGTSSNGKIHSIFDLQIHPFYQGTNKSYDLAALKSESSLINGKAAELPTALDYSMITIGERFQVLGFGAYRTVDKSVMGLGVRRVHVYRVPATQCPGSEPWSLRHLTPARAVPPSPCAGAGAALCAGPLYARGLPCNYCSGTPLLRGHLLLGLMSDNQQCGVACEPQLYVNIAAVGDWIDGVLKGE